MKMRGLETLLCLAIAIGFLGCERKETSTQPPAVSAPSASAAKVTAIELGNAVGADGRVAVGAAKTTFAPTDTIYVSVLTDKPPAGATLSARWTYGQGK